MPVERTPIKGYTTREKNPKVKSEQSKIKEERWEH